MELGLCFFNKECIAEREKKRAEAQQALLQQQQTLQGLLNTQSGGVSNAVIISIAVGIILITITTIVIVKKRNKTK